MKTARLPGCYQRSALYGQFSDGYTSVSVWDLPGRGRGYKASGKKVSYRTRAHCSVVFLCGPARFPNKCRTIRDDDDDHVRMFFEYAGAAGIPMLVIAPTAKNMPRIERFVKEYDISVAIHNHGPEDSHFPGPRDGLEVIRDMDPRVGLCIDVGHTARTGVDVVESIAEAGDRLLDMHMKDLRDMSDRTSQCIVGEGAMPVADIFRQLAEMNYQGYVNLEYEIDANDPLPGMKQSFAYMRGVLAGMAA